MDLFSSPAMGAKQSKSGETQTTREIIYTFIENTHCCMMMVQYFFLIFL